jgi:acyl dehydratase
MSIISGLITRTGVMEGTVLAFREVVEWKFSLPVFFGDTVHAETEVIETKPYPRLGGGAVVIKVNVKNHKGVVVQSGKWNVLMMSRPK